EKGYSAQLLHNLGNSYARSGRIGYAVLSYERALRLLPSAGDTRGNLELVRKEAGLFKEQQFFRDYFEPLLQLDQWLLFLLCLIILTTTLEAVTLLRPLPGKNHRLLLCCLLFLITAAAAGTIFKWYDLHSGVVVTSNSRLMLSPFDSAPSSGIIEEGRMVQIMSTHGDFVRVRTRSGREGWLSIAPHEPDVAPLRKY
ncbi:MAG: tetratricopeptide repeat protein, partial [Thermodesulfobacteriota bacterium]